MNTNHNAIQAAVSGESSHGCTGDSVDTKPRFCGGSGMARHQELVKAVRSEMRRHGVVMWPMTPGGVAVARGSQMLCGCVGVADLNGILPPSGRWIAFEMKTGRFSYQSREQRAWQATVEKSGGYYAVIRSVEDAVRHIAIAGESNMGRL